MREREARPGIQLALEGRATESILIRQELEQPVPPLKNPGTVGQPPFPPSHDFREPEMVNRGVLVLESAAIRSKGGGFSLSAS
jgi:hypothetical protein